MKRIRNIAVGLVVIALAVGMKMANAQFTSPSCPPSNPTCNPIVIQNIAIGSTAQNASINVAGDMKLGQRLESGGGAYSLPASKDLLFGNIAGGAGTNNLIHLQVAGVDKVTIDLNGLETIASNLNVKGGTIQNTTGGLTIQSAAASPVTIDSGNGTVTLGAGDSLTVPGTLTVNGSLSLPSGTLSGNGSGLTNVTASGLAAGTYANAYTFNNASNSFTGNGSGLTSLTGANVTGTVANATNAVNATNATNATAATRATYLGASNNVTANGNGNVSIAAATTLATDNALYVNETSGPGQLLLLQTAGVDKFKVDNTGTLTVGIVPWARLSSFPAACPAGQYASAVGGTLTCSTPAFTDTDTLQTVSTRGSTTTTASGISSTATSAGASGVTGVGPGGGSGNGVYGTNAGIGVQGVGTGASSIGVQGVANNGLSGVYAGTIGTTPYAIYALGGGSAWGLNAQSGSGYGVWGTTTSGPAGGRFTYGAAGPSVSLGTSSYSIDANGNANIAGNLNVTGTITGTFADSDTLQTVTTRGNSTTTNVAVGGATAGSYGVIAGNGSQFSGVRGDGLQYGGYFTATNAGGAIGVYGTSPWTGIRGEVSTNAPGFVNDKYGVLGMGFGVGTAGVSGFGNGAQGYGVIGTSGASGVGVYGQGLDAASFGGIFTTAAGGTALSASGGATGLNVTGSTNAVYASGNISITGGRYFAVGNWSAATPDYSFGADSNTGIYKPAAYTVGIVGNGSEIARFGPGVALMGPPITAGGAYQAAASAFAAIGSQAGAVGTFSTAIGIGTCAGNTGGGAPCGGGTSNPYTTAIGYWAKSDGNGSIAIGQTVEAAGNGSYIFGRGLYGDAQALVNNVQGAIMFGVNSTLPTMEIFPANGAGTYGTVSIGSNVQPGFGLVSKLYISTANAATAQIMLNNLGSAVDKKNYVIASGNDSLTFGKWNDAVTSGLELMRLDNNGNLDIGTGTAAGKLTVGSGAAGAKTVISVGRTAGEGELGVVANAYDSMGGDQAGDVFLRTLTNTQRLMFGVGPTINNAMMVINHTGVGVGSPSSPTHAFEVTGDTYHNGNIGILTPTPYDALDMNYTGAIRWGYSPEPTNYYARAYFSPNGGGDPNQTALNFQVHSWPSGSVYTPLSLTGAGRVRFFGSSSTEFYQNGSRINVRAEGVDNVAQFASYGMWLPQAGGTTNLYIGGTMYFGYPSNALSTIGSGWLCLTGGTYGAVAACGSSSIRYKKDVADLTLGLDTVMQMRPVTYTWKENGKEGFGFIAEDMKKISPLLTYDNNSGQVEGVQYPYMSAVMAKAIQELDMKVEDGTVKINARLDDHEARIKTVESASQDHQDEIKALQAQVEALQARVQQLESR